MWRTNKRVVAGHLLPRVLLTALLCSMSGASARHLAQAPWTVNRTLVDVRVIDTNNKTVNATTKLDTRSPDRTGDMDLIFDDGGLSGVVLRAKAAYPNPVYDNPEGWRFKTMANSTLVFAYPSELTTGSVELANDARADSKLAPATAIAGTYAELNGTLASVADASAMSRPGLQYGATVAVADQTLISTSDYAFDYSTGIRMATRSRAEAGQGQTVSLARARGDTKEGVSASQAFSRSWASRWYLAPGHAISGIANIGNGGRSYTYSNNRARAALGTATAGVLNYGTGSGDFVSTTYASRGGPFSDGDYGSVSNFIDNRADVDAGNAAAGYVSLGRAAVENIYAANDPGAAASTAVGNAVAGGITAIIAETDGAFIGDYDDEWDTYENDVSATARGRGTAQAGQINIALAPNGDSSTSGWVKATAAQGAAVAGAFTLTNSAVEAYQGVHVDARTAEYDAVAGNVGVAQAGNNGEIANAATAKTTTGSALAFNIANAAVSSQNAASSASDATTTFGQAASIAAAQAVEGSYGETQGASSATTTEGNALSIGSGFSGAALVSRSIGTAAAAAQAGQAVSSAWSGSIAADTDANAASSAATVTGNAVSIAQGYSLGVLEGKAVVANSAATEAGSAGGLGIALATGLIQAQSKVASSAETKDGRAQSTAVGLSLADMNSISDATSSSASETGDVTSNTLAVAAGLLHGEAAASSTSGTGCKDCISDSVANAISIGIIADSLARAASDTDKNPGNALANAMAFGLISRTSNGGSSRVAIGPGQAVAGGFAVSGPSNLAPVVAAAAAGQDLGDREGEGTGDRTGEGTGDGTGSGTGDGTGSGTGDGTGSGTGEVTGSGTGDGTGSGTEEGAGDGAEEGTGTGTGDTSADKAGDSTGTGNGSGDRTWIGAETGDDNGPGQRAGAGGQGETMESGTVEWVKDGTLTASSSNGMTANSGEQSNLRTSKLSSSISRHSQLIIKPVLAIRNDATVAAAAAAPQAAKVADVPLAAVPGRTGHTLMVRLGEISPAAAVPPTAGASRSAVSPSAAALKEHSSIADLPEARQAEHQNGKAVAAGSSSSTDLTALAAYTATSRSSSGSGSSSDGQPQQGDNSAAGSSSNSSMGSSSSLQIRQILNSALLLNPDQLQGISAVDLIQYARDEVRKKIASRTKGGKLGQQMARYKQSTTSRKSA